MFSNKQKNSNRPEAGAPPRAAAPSIISADLTINGNLNSDGDVQVDGTVEGDINSNKLTVSSTATVRGAIECETVVIAGNVTGQIKAGHLTLNKTARVIADVIQERLSIEPGAFFEGNCRHFPNEAEKKASPKLEPVKPAVARREGEDLSQSARPGNGAAVAAEATS